MRSTLKEDRAGGFTFIELVVVISMMAVISLAAYGVFKNGITIWQKASRQVREEDLNIFFDKVNSDVHDAFKFKGIPFAGEKERFQFATIVYSPRLQRKTVGDIAYFYDGQKRAVKRAKRDMSQVVNDAEGELIEETLSGVKALRCSYYYYDRLKKQYLWQDEWTDRETMPLAVRMEFEFQNGSDTDRYTTTVSIPAAG